MSIGIIRNRRALALAAALITIVTACGGDDDDAATSEPGTEVPAAATAAPGTATGADTEASIPASSGVEGEPITLQLGYFPNVTHAPAIIGLQTGLFADALGASVTLEARDFNSGTEVVEAMLAEDLDASFIGPNPAINGYAKSDGELLRIVAGTTSGGASLVVREGIDDPADLAGTTLATPSLGNTQDVALRAWLTEQGFTTDTAGGGDVAITPQENADTLTAFQTGAIDGAWVPEPWATRLVEEGGGTVLVDERDIWPDGRFVTTHLIVTTELLEDRPDVVKALITGLADAVDEASGDAEAAQAIVNDGIEEATTNRLADATMAGAWEQLEFTLDPVASSLQTSADNAVAAELLDPVDLATPGIYDLTLLNEVLASRGEDEVSGL